MSGTAKNQGIYVPNDVDPNRIFSLKELSSLTGLPLETLKSWVLKGVVVKTKIGPRSIGIRWRNFLEIVRDEVRAS